MNGELEAYKRHLGSQQAPPHVETAVMAAFRARLCTPRRKWLLGPVAAAAALAAILIWRSAKVDGPAPVTPSLPAHAPELATDFFALPGALPPTGPDTAESRHLIRIRIPRSEMRRFGLPVSFESDTPDVAADVLLGADGVARAVRFVR